MTAARTSATGTPVTPTGPHLLGLKLTSLTDFSTVVRLTLDVHGHDRRRTALALDIGERTLYRWMRAYPMLTKNVPTRPKRPHTLANTPAANTPPAERKVSSNETPRRILTPSPRATKCKFLSSFRPCSASRTPKAVKRSKKYRSGLRFRRPTPTSEEEARGRGRRRHRSR